MPALVGATLWSVATVATSWRWLSLVLSVFAALAAAAASEPLMASIVARLILMTEPERSSVEPSTIWIGVVVRNFVESMAVPLRSVVLSEMPWGWPS